MVMFPHLCCAGGQIRINEIIPCGLKYLDIFPSDCYNRKKNIPFNENPNKTELLQI